MKPTAKVIPYTPGDTSHGPMLPGDVSVEFRWEGVDRPCTYGIVCAAKHAPRLVKACDAGVLFRDAKVATDVDGKTYVNATCQVSGRHLNADLSPDHTYCSRTCFKAAEREARLEAEWEARVS